MSEYLDEFVQESEESITELNNALLELERDPDDVAVDDVFRTAHTLKGNFGAMGFERASDLAHAIEDLLDAVRAGSLSITPELMDEVFDAVDDLERMLGEIDRHGDIETDPSDRIDSLRSWVEESTGLARPSEAESERLLDRADRAPRDDHRTFHARLSLAGPGSADTALTALSDAFDLLVTDPAAPAAVETATRIDVAFGSAVSETAVAAALDPVEAVEDAIVTAVDPAVVERATGRADDTGPATTVEGDPETMAVDDLLDQFDEYDDLDEAVERADDVAGLENMGEAGAFDDIVEEDIDPVYEQSTPSTATGTDTGDADAPEPDADETVENPTREFERLKREYDTVGLDRLAAELEDVEFGEYDDEDEVGFDELLSDDLLADADETATPESAEGDEATPETDTDLTPDAVGTTDPVSVSAPDEATVDALLDAARPPASFDRRVRHARLAVPADDPDAGTAVVEALRDAVDLLGTDPPESDLVAGDHDDTVDAVFGSDLPAAEVRAALHAVDGVRAAHLTDVTDRVGSGSDTADTAGDDPAIADDDVDPAVVQAEGEIEDAMSEFKQMQQTYDTVGLDRLAAELEDVEFGEYDEDEVGFDELLGEDTSATTADATEDDAASATDSASAPSQNAEPGETASTAGPADSWTDANPATPPTEAAISTTLADVETAPEGRMAYHLALEVHTDPDRNNATRVVKALRDAFDLLTTRPDASTVEAEAPARVEAVVGSHVDESAIRAALDDVDEVGTVHVTEVTDRVTPSVDAETDTEAASTDAMSEFQSIQDRHDTVDVEEIETELADADIPGVDTREEVGVEDLLNLAETDDTEPAPDGPTTTADDLGVEDIDLENIDDLEDDVEGDLDDVAAGSEFGVDVDASPVTGPGESASEPSSTAEPDAAASSTPSEPTPAPDPSVPDAARADVQSITGIGPAYADRLGDAGVETVGDLVTAQVGRLTAATDISDSRIEEWVERAPVSADDVRTDDAVDAPDAATESETESESASIQSIRVDVDQVDELLNLVEEMVTSRARMRRALDDIDADIQPLAEELDELDVIGTEMQDVVMDMRLVPVRTVTQRLPRVVRDVAREQDKRVQFDVEGEDVEVDRSILSRIGDPLIHLVRNAVDHGIEPPERRREAGKDEEGQITLRAYRARDTVYVEVEDDGRGLDPDQLRAAAVERGTYTEDEAERVSDETARELIFRPGFSTTEDVTDVSGRGVGMDVVATTVEDLDGDVEVESEVGEGTTIRLALPVSVAISEVLFVEVGDEEYGVPIRVVDEIEGMGAAQPVTDGGEVVRIDEDERELIDLGEAMNVPGRDEDRPMGGPQERGMLVTLEDEVRQAAIRCDRVRGQQEVVVKPFEGFMTDVPGLGGAAILGEGDVVTILDVETL